MVYSKFLRRFALFVALIAASATSTAWAQQVSPVGASDTSVGPGAGLVSPVSATGGYQASAPIDLPKSRGRFTVPFQIRYDATSETGAAGVGWDIPLSYVRRSDDEWRRKPAAGASTYIVPERIILSLGGTRMYMVQSSDPDVYLPFIASEYMELHVVGGSWTLHTDDGVEYLFDPVSTVGDGTFEDANLWLLTRITDRVGSDHAELRYATTSASCDGTHLELEGITYGFNAAATRALYDIQLVREPWWVAQSEDNKFHGAFGTQCGERFVGGIRQRSFRLGLSSDTGRYIGRSEVVTQVIVQARNNLDDETPLRAIKTYVLGYLPDGDTRLPRLSTVKVFGEEDSEGGSLPLVHYSYGAVSQSEDDNLVRYGDGVVVPRDPAAEMAGADALGSSEVTTELYFLTDKVRRDTVRMRSVLRDSGSARSHSRPSESLG